MADAPEVQSNGGAVPTDPATAEKQQVQQPTFDINAPEVQAFVQQAVDAATKSFKKEKDDFRENNIRLMKLVEEYKSSGLQPDEIKSIAQNIKKNKEVELAAKGQYEELVAMRIEPVRRDYEAKLEAANSTIDELTQKYRATDAENFDLIIGSKVHAAIEQHKDIVPGAGELIKEQARKVWRKDETGKIRPYRANGTPWISKDQTDITFYDWINELRDPFPFFFSVKPGLTARGGPGQTNLDYLNSIQNPMERLERARQAGVVKPIYSQS